MFPGWEVDSHVAVCTPCPPTPQLLQSAKLFSFLCSADAMTSVVVERVMQPLLLPFLRTGISEAAAALSAQTVADCFLMVRALLSTPACVCVLRGYWNSITRSPFHTRSPPAVHVPCLFSFVLLPTGREGL